MSSYSLSGSGTHALTAGTTGLQVTITTPSSIGGSGRSNPVAKYDQGLFRFSDGTAYWEPVPILGGPQFIPVPANATSFGYALLGGAQVSVVEVIGGTVFFSGSGGAAALDNAHNALAADVAITAANTYYDGPSIALSAGTWIVVGSVFISCATANNVQAKLWDGSSVYASGQQFDPNGYSQISLSAIVVLSAPGTVKISAASSTGGNTIRAATIHNGSGNNASSVAAVKIA